MSFDGNGNWTSNFYPVQDRDNGIAILASKFQTLIQENLKESFENCITRDGAGKPITNINWNGNKITNLQNGTSSADAVNKSQLDSVSTSLSDSKVSKSGDTMTGDLTISKGNPRLSLINSNSSKYFIQNTDNSNLLIVNDASGVEKGIGLRHDQQEKPYYWNGTTAYDMPHIVSFYSGAGPSGVIKWSNGLIQQWGYVSGSTLTFHVPFTQDGTITIIGNNPSGASTGGYKVCITGVTTTYATLYYGSGDQGGGLVGGTYWFATGI